MKFSYKDKDYETWLKYKRNQIKAICDTGATTTSFDIFSASNLIGVNSEELYNKAIEWSEQNKTMCVHTASGNIDSAIYIVLHNIFLDNIYFRNFYARLNINNNLWRTDGFVDFMVGNTHKQFSIPPYILIGLDIIQLCSINGSKDAINLLNFDYQVYQDSRKRRFEKEPPEIIPLHIYQLQDIEL